MPLHHLTGRDLGKGCYPKNKRSQQTSNDQLSPHFSHLLFGILRQVGDFEYILSAVQVMGVLTDLLRDEIVDKDVSRVRGSVA
jgi:hypothetical protein